MRTKERVKQFGEVFTPQHIVNQMLDLLPAEAWTTPRYQFVEPACGNGAFVVELIKRRIAGVVSTLASPTMHQIQCVALHSICDVFACDILEDNVKECRDRVLNCVEDIVATYAESGLLDDRVDNYTQTVEAIKHHIFQADALKFDFTQLRRFDDL